MMHARGLKAAILTGACVIAVAGGCAGHGKYTQEHKDQAEERLATIKSGSEWSMARQQFLGGDLRKALKSVDQSIALNDNVAKAHTLRGRILLELGELQDARVAFDRALEIDAETAEAHYYIGVIGERLSRPEEALTAYRAAAEADSTDPQFVIAQAEMLIELGRLDEAERLLDSSRSKFEYESAVRQSLGHILMIRGNAEGAASVYREASLLAPDSPGVIEDLVRALVASGQYAEAEFQLSRLLDMPEHADRRDLKRLRGRCLMETDRLLDARHVYEELTEGVEGAADVDAWTAAAKLACAMDDDMRLQRSTQRLVSIAPRLPEAHTFRAIAHRNRGRLEEALESAAKAAELAKDDPSALILRGLIERDLGRDQDALASFVAAIKLDPQCEQAQRLVMLHSKTADGAYATVPDGSQSP